MFNFRSHSSYHIQLGKEEYKVNDFTKVNSTYNSTYVDMTDENGFYEIKNRKIIPPENPTKIIQTENNSQIITFTTDRYQEGIDLATKRINIVCKNAMHKKYTFPAVNVYVNDTDLRFSWLIKRDVSIYHGIVIFKVEFLGDTNDIYDGTTTENDNTDYSLVTGNCTLEVLRSVNFSNASTSEQNYWYTDLLQQVGATTQEVTGHLIERLDKFTENFGEVGGNQYCRKFTNVFYKDVKGLTLDEVMDLSSESVYLKIKLPNTYNAGKKFIIDFSVSTYWFSSQYQVVLDSNNTNFKSYVSNNDVFGLKIASDDDGYYIILGKDVTYNRNGEPSVINTYAYRGMTIAVNSVVVAPPSLSNVGGVYEIVEDCDYINGFDASYTYDISDLTVLYEHEVNKGLNSEKINGNRITSSNSVPPTKDKDDIWVTDDSIRKYNGENWIDVIKTTRTQENILVNGVDGLGVANGTAIPAGKTLDEIIKMLVQKAIPPTYTSPTITIANNSGTASGNKEAGTTITPKLKTTFTQNDAGSLTKIAILKGTAEVGSSTSSPYSYTGSSFVLGDETVTYKAQAAYEAGDVKKNNLGNDDATGQILAGTITSSTYSFVGLRNLFYGTGVGNIPSLTSAFVRNLSNKKLNPTQGYSFNISVAIGQQYIVFAYPATLRDVSQVTYVETNDTGCASNFTKALVDVADARGGNSGLKSYKVYTYKMDAPASATMTFKVTI